MENMSSLVFMSISEILILILFFVILFSQKKKNQLKQAFLWFLGFMFIWAMGSILQILCQNKPIEPVFFEKIAGIGVFFSPVAFLALGFVFAKTKIHLRWYHCLFLVIPVISFFVLCTNEMHHLFFEVYSYKGAEMLYGKYFSLHSLYTYSLFGIGLIYFLRYSIKNSGFFSKQSILIIIGTSFPLVLNLLGTLNVIPITTYITPISFSFMILFYAFAIFKFDFMKVTPIALQRIVDIMSDGYIVLNEDNVIIDFNKTFLKMFNLTDINLRNKDLFELLRRTNYLEIDLDQFKKQIKLIRNSNEMVRFERSSKLLHKHFNIEITDIKAKNNFLGILILLKDITQHVDDMNTIKDNQELLMEKERLASLGQLIGGIAHNLKTPIMSIAGAAEGLHDLTTEYDESIGDPEVTYDDHHAIAKDMNEWIEKIKTHTSYMSDVITAVKGQAVVLSEEDRDAFTIEELIKRVNILMKHELKNALIDLNTNMNGYEAISLTGNVNSLVQVINNMISNSIQAYNGKTNESIDLSVSQEDEKVIISIRDYGCGIKKEVLNKLFKEMITTKGKNGTGLGLFMSYSTIRAHFNGTITFHSEEGQGTTFNIILPL